MKLLLQVHVDVQTLGGRVAGVPTAQLGDSLPGRRAVATGQPVLCYLDSEDISLCVWGNVHLLSSVWGHLPK